jgi:hypothetical protein
MFPLVFVQVDEVPGQRAEPEGRFGNMFRIAYQSKNAAVVVGVRGVIQKGYAGNRPGFFGQRVYNGLIPAFTEIRDTLYQL